MFCRMADTRFYFFGDSLTLGVGDPQALGWVGRVMRALGARGPDGRADTPEGELPATFYNLGVRGDTSGGIARRFRAELDARRPDGVAPRMVFAFGVNDARTLYPGGPSLLLADETRSYARAIFTGAQALGPVLMVGPPAVADEPSDAHIAERSEQLAELCAELGVPFIPVHAATRADPDYLPALDAGDGYHPGALGYELLAAVVQRHEAWARFTTGAA